MIGHLLQKLKIRIHIACNLWIGLLHSDDNKIFQRQTWIIFVTFIRYDTAFSLFFWLALVRSSYYSQWAIVDQVLETGLLRIVDQELVHKKLKSHSCWWSQKHSVRYLPGELYRYIPTPWKLACTGNPPVYTSPDLHKFDPCYKVFLFNFCAYFPWLISVQLDPFLTGNMLPAEAFEMRKHLNLSMAKPR